MSRRPFDASRSAGPPPVGADDATRRWGIRTRWTRATGAGSKHSSPRTVAQRTLRPSFVERQRVLALGRASTALEDLHSRQGRRGRTDHRHRPPSRRRRFAVGGAGPRRSVRRLGPGARRDNRQLRHPLPSARRRNRDSGDRAAARLQFPNQPRSTSTSNSRTRHLASNSRPIPRPPSPGTTPQADEPPGGSLRRTIEAAVIDNATRVWAAGEAASVQAIRKHLFEQRDVPRAHTTIRGYWKVPR